MSKCADCGFLEQKFQNSAKRMPIAPEFRKTGNPPTNNPEIFGYPLYAAEARDLQEWAMATPGEGRVAKVHTIFQEEWDCPEFYQHRLGRDTAEHAEMRELEVIRKAQNEREQQMLAREAERDRLANEREDKRDAKLDAWQKRQARRESIRWGITVVAMIVAAILGGLFSQS